MDSNNKINLNNLINPNSKANLQANPANLNNKINLDNLVNPNATNANVISSPKSNTSLSTFAATPVSKEVPETKLQKFTHGAARTLGSILGAVSLPETVVGGLIEFLTNPNSDLDIVRQKALKTLKGDITEIGTQKGLTQAIENKVGHPLSRGQHIATTLASIGLDMLVNPLSYLTFGSGTAIDIPAKIGEEAAIAGTKEAAVTGAKAAAEVAPKTIKAYLTSAGKTAYASFIKAGVENGLTREAATEAAKETMGKLLQEGVDRYFSKGGVRFAEWLPKVGGQSIISQESISKVVRPIAKVTGISKATEAIKNSDLVKAINRAINPMADVPEDLYKASRKAFAERSFETAKAAQEYQKSLLDLGRFNSKEAEQIFDAIRKPELYEAAPDKIKKAADIIAKRFSDLREGLVKRGVDIGYLENYVPYLYKDEFGKEFAENLKNISQKFEKVAGEKTVNVGGLSRKKEFFEYPRTLFNTVEQAQQAGFKINKNIFDALDAYEAGASRIHAFMDLVDKVKNQAVDLTKEGAKIPEGFVKGTGLLEKYALPKDTARYLGNFQKLFFDNAEMRTFLKYYDKALGWWKTMATVESPGFHIRNFLSNLFNSWLGGNQDIRNYFDAMKIIKNPTAEVVTNAGEKVTGERILEEAAKRNVLGKGWFGYAGELGTDRLAQRMMPTYKKVLQGVNPLSTQSYAAKFGRKFGASVEEYSRLAHFIDVFKKTGDFDKAAEETFKFLFDYSELTPFWKNVMNRVMPFGTWLRKNTALQFEQLLKQPAKYAVIPEFKKFAESFSENEKPDETYLPEYLKKEIAIRMPLKDENGNFYYARLDLPYLGISDITDWRTLFSSLSPAIRIPIELFAGKQIYTGKDIEKYPGYTAPVPGYIGILPSAIKKNIGVVRAKNPATGEYEQRMNPYIAYLLMQNPMAVKVGKLIPFPEETEYQKSSRPANIASILGGIGFTPYNQQYYKKVFEKEQQNLANAYNKRLKQIKKWS